MTMYQRGDWTCNLNIEPSRESFLWYVVRFRIGPARSTGVVLGTWVAGGITANREEAEREGRAAIDRAPKP